MRLVALAFSILAVLTAPVAAAAAQDSEQPLITFPQSAGEAAVVGVPILREGERCQVEASSGNAVTDAFACSVGPAQMRRIDGRVYAISWIPPRFEGSFVPAVEPGAEEARRRERRRHSGRPIARATLVPRLTIDARGVVTECVIASSSGDEDLDRMYCRHARGERYTPATLNGERVAETRYELVTLVARPAFTTFP